MNLEEIKALEAKATKGPWYPTKMDIFPSYGVWRERTGYGACGGQRAFLDVLFDTSHGCASYDDEQFAAASREAVPWLIAEVDRLRAALREIAEHEHDMEDPNDDYFSAAVTIYGPHPTDIVLNAILTGYVAGHRCAAEIARKALEGK